MPLIENSVALFGGTHHYLHVAYLTDLHAI